LLKPRAIVFAQRFTPGEADEAGAVALPGAPFVAEFVELHLGNPGEPAAKTFPVVERAQLRDIGDPIVVQIGVRTGFRFR